MIEWFHSVGWDQWAKFAALMVLAAGVGRLKRKLDQEHGEEEP